MISVFLKKIFLYLLPLALLVCLVNFIVDPGNLYSRVEEKIADYLLQGFNVTGEFNLDIRALQRIVIQNLKSPPEIVVIGSSRIMEVGKDIYGSSTLNNGVSGASLEDFIALFQMYDQRGILPKKVVIGIDPWLLNNNSEQERYKILQREYYSFFGKEVPWYERLPLLKYSQLFSPSYFQEAVKLAPQVYRRKIEPTQNEVNDKYTRLTDGTITYDVQYRKASSQEVEQRAQKFIAGNIYSLENFDVLSEKIKADFDIFIDSLKKKNIEVEFIFMPYHPVVYSYLEKNSKYAKVKEVEIFMKEYAQENNFMVKGSYDPSVYALGSKDFYDGMHMTRDGLSKIWTQ